jgi:hypothetical protein
MGSFNEKRCKIIHFYEGQREPHYAILIKKLNFLLIYENASNTS